METPRLGVEQHHHRIEVVTDANHPPQFITFDVNTNEIERLSHAMGGGKIDRIILQGGLAWSENSYKPKNIQSIEYELSGEKAIAYIPKKLWSMTCFRGNWDREKKTVTLYPDTMLIAQNRIMSCDEALIDTTSLNKTIQAIIAHEIQHANQSTFDLLTKDDKFRIFLLSTLLFVEGVSIAGTVGYELVGKTPWMNSEQAGPLALLALFSLLSSHYGLTHIKEINEDAYAAEKHYFNKSWKEKDARKAAEDPKLIQIAEKAIKSRVLLPKHIEWLSIVTTE